MSGRDESQRRAEQTMRRLQHEVRTPISQIIGYAELLEEELEDRGVEDLAPDLQKIRSAAQRLLDLADGRLRDEADAGAPVLPDAERDAPLADMDAEPARGSRILAVDGDANQRELLVRRLERSGFSVDVAGNGLEALRHIEANEPDLVLLEILLPGMNGLEVLERIRRQRSRAELPVVLATTLDDSVDAVEGLDRGANDYVTKPFDYPVVIARVRSQLEAHRMARQVAGLARQLEFRSAFIREALGREVAGDLLVELAERPEALDLGQAPIPVVALVVDVRGSRRLAAAIAPAQQSAVMKNVLDGLAEVIGRYGGIVDSVNGDSLVALFGLPLRGEDDAERAVACAVALQLEMEEINERAARVNLPSVEVGVGVASGNVMVLGLGTGAQLKYKALGDALLEAAAVESRARAGEVWICAGTHEAVAGVVESDQTGEVPRPRVEGSLRTYRVLGVGGARLISLRGVPGS
jgi:DNA-binding response OmpR family regulator